MLNKTFAVGWLVISLTAMIHVGARAEGRAQGNPPAGLRMIIDNLEISALPAEGGKGLRSVHLRLRKPLKGVNVRLDTVTATATAGGGYRKGWQ